MAPKIKARKIENGYVLSCNGKEFSSGSKEGAVAIAQELYCKEDCIARAKSIVDSEFKEAA